MHPENIYAKGIDYDSIYKEYPEARQHLFLNQNGRAFQLPYTRAQSYFTTFLLKRKPAFEIFLFDTSNQIF